MTYHYFISFSWSAPDGSSGFGQSECCQPVPLEEFAQVAKVAEAIAARFEAKTLVVILFYTLLRTSA